MHADSMPIKSTMPGYPTAEIVATMKAERISIILATKCSSPILCGPAVSADQLHEHARLIVFANDTCLGFGYAHQNLVLFISYRNNQSAAGCKLGHQRL